MTYFIIFIFSFRNLISLHCRITHNSPADITKEKVTKLTNNLENLDLLDLIKCYCKKWIDKKVTIKKQENRINNCVKTFRPTISFASKTSKIMMKKTIHSFNGICVWFTDKMFLIKNCEKCSYKNSQNSHSFDLPHVIQWISSSFCLQQSKAIYAYTHFIKL